MALPFFWELCITYFNLHFCYLESLPASSVKQEIENCHFFGNGETYLP
jgi:hypothetical protein